jgi:hypothetical protein
MDFEGSLYIASQSGLHVSLLSCVLVATEPRCGLKWLHVSHASCRINLWFSWSIDYILVRWGSNGYLPDACLWSHCWTTYLLVWMKSLPSLELVGCGGLLGYYWPCMSGTLSAPYDRMKCKFLNYSRWRLILCVG